jgi:hypothetical protein
MLLERDLIGGLFLTQLDNLTPFLLATSIILKLVLYSSLGAIGNLHL